MTDRRDQIPPTKDEKAEGASADGNASPSGTPPSAIGDSAVRGHQDPPSRRSRRRRRRRKGAKKALAAQANAQAQANPHADTTPPGTSHQPGEPHSGSSAEKGTESGVRSGRTKRRRKRDPAQGRRPADNPPVKEAFPDGHCLAPPGPAADAKERKSCDTVLRDALKVSRVEGVPKDEAATDAGIVADVAPATKAEAKNCRPGERSGGGGDRSACSARKRQQALYAALDLGTNNCRLLIAEPQERGFRVVDAFSRIVRLGEGLSQSGRLSDAAMERALSALAVCRRKLEDRGVARARLVATEACRIADNGERFVERIEAETGLAIEIVNRETEARLAVAGCATLIDREADGVVLFDIGGGSSELVWLDLRNRTHQRGIALTRFIRSWMSLPLGVVTLSERHGGVHVTPELFETMVEDVLGALDRFREADALCRAVARGRVHMLGTSGTVTTLAGIHLELPRYDRRRVDGTWLGGTEMSAMIDRLVSMSYEERVANPCIGADRADLVLAGCAILEAIHRKWPCTRLRVADRGLREGILVELMSADGVWRRRHNRSRPRRPNRGPNAAEEKI